jgi:hypothetical protein
MAINLRNRPNDGDAYKVSDLALAAATESNNGVVYSSTTNETTVHIAASDSKQDFIKVGDYVIPQRADCPSFNSPGVQFNIVHPLRPLQIVSIEKDAATNPTYRRFKLSGDQRKYFAGAGVPATSPQGYGLDGILIRNIVRGRKYRIKDLGSGVKWNKFGRLYSTEAEREPGRKLALVGTTFTATASGLSSAGEAEDLPVFTVGNYGSASSPRDLANAASIGATDSPYIITGVADNRFSDSVNVNGTYFKKTSEIYQHQDQPVRIELKGSRKQWTIYNYKTSRIYYEDTKTTSDGKRFDSPGPLGGVANSYSSTNTIVWQDRAVSVPTDDHYGDSNSDNEGRVIEVMHISSIYSGNEPLTNKEIDQNFIDVESKKLASDGSMPMDGKLSVFGDISGYNLSITDKITIGGVQPYSANTAIALGTRDLEVNNIRISGTLNDDALFRKYKVTGFPHSFLADYNTEMASLEPMTILFFANVSEFAVDGSTITSSLSNKTGVVRRVNTTEGYVMVKETSSNKSFQVGEKINGKYLAGQILKVMEPSDYLTEGQNLKIFGMNMHDTPLARFHYSGVGATEIEKAQKPATPAAPVATKRGAETGTTSYDYRIALMNKDTGKISVLSAVSNTVGSALDLVEFNKTDFVRIVIANRFNTSNMILVYRRKGSGSYRLVDILDNTTLGSGTTNLEYNDYGGYDKTTYGLNASPASEYAITRDSGIVYVPTSAADSELAQGETATTKQVLPFVGNNKKYDLGFLETKIEGSVIKTTDVNSNESPAYFRITETKQINGTNYSPNLKGHPYMTRFSNGSPVFYGKYADQTIYPSVYNSPDAGAEASAPGFSNVAPYGKANEVEFFVDNGRIVDSPNGNIIGGIQKLIMDAAASGRRTTSLPGGTYYTKLLTLPNNFKLQGQSRTNTILKSLPWLSDATNTKTLYGGSDTSTDTDTRDPYVAAASEGQGYIRKEYIPYFRETGTGEITSAAGSGVQRFFAAVKNTVEIGTTNGVPDNSKGIFSGILAGHISYSRGLIDFDGKTGVTVANIGLDGNYSSNIPNDVTISGKSSALMLGQRSKNCFLQDISIRNSTLAGISAANSIDLSMEGSVISRGGSKISQSAFATGLYLPGNEKLRLSNNLIENFSETNDLTSNLNVVLSGNMIKNTGSGILAYATSNLITESNLIIGPADEFIPIADTLAGEFDQLNLDLAQDTAFTSDPIQYNRDNSPVDLRPPQTGTDALTIPGVSIHSSIRALVQRGTTQTLLPKTTEGKNFDATFSGVTSGTTYAITSGVVDDDPGNGDPSLQAGNFRIKVTSSALTNLNTNFNGTGSSNLQIKYDSLTERPSGESLVGLVYQVIGTEYLFLDKGTSTRQGDPVINWTGSKVDLTNFEVTLRIAPSNSTLFSVGDRVIFTCPASSESLNGIASLTTLTRNTAATQDSNGNETRVSFLIKSKNVQGSYTDIVLDISESTGGISATERSGLTGTNTEVISLSSIATETERNDSKIGIQNQFVLSKGRILL